MSTKIKATPKTLLEAIDNGKEAVDACLEEYSDMFDSEVRMLHIKDFLSQHFTIAILESCSDEERERLEKLFRRITK